MKSSSTVCTTHLVFATRYLLDQKFRDWVHSGGRCCWSILDILHGIGIPQGRLLRPILFLLYTSDVLDIAAWLGVGVHSYAEDTQLYLHTTTNNCKATFACLLCCINEVGLWMFSNRLKLNTEETHFTCCGTWYQLAKVNITACMVKGTSYCHLPWRLKPQWFWGTSWSSAR